MKHVKLFEQFINEGKVKVEKTGYGGVSIGLTGSDEKEVIFSSDKETLEAVIRALEDKIKPADVKLWHSIVSRDGDIYMERDPGSNTVTLRQVEDIPKYDIEFEFPASELKGIIKDLKKLIKK